jgi:hypothetical protein
VNNRDYYIGAGIILALLIATGVVFFIELPNLQIGLYLAAATLVVFIVMIAYGLIKGSRVQPIKASNLTAAMSEERRDRAQEIYKQRIEEAIKIAQRKSGTISPDEKILASVYKGELQKDDICMVCKLFLKKGDDILQCPVCERLYHKNHLLEWIRKHNNCPVCSQQLYEVEKN